MKYKTKLSMKARIWTTVRMGLQIRLKIAQKNPENGQKYFVKAFNIALS